MLIHLLLTGLCKLLVIALTLEDILDYLLLLGLSNFHIAFSLNALVQLFSVLLSWFSNGYKLIVILVQVNIVWYAIQVWCKWWSLSCIYFYFHFFILRLVLRSQHVWHPFLFEFLIVMIFDIWFLLSRHVLRFEAWFNVQTSYFVSLRVAQWSQISCVGVFLLVMRPKCLLVSVLQLSFIWTL